MPPAEEPAEGNRGSATRFEVTSAGTRGIAGVEMDPRTADELRRLDASPEDFRSNVLTKEDCEQADLILTSTLTQRSGVLARCPMALRRTFTLMEFSQKAPRVYGRQGRACAPRALVKLMADARGSAPIDTYDVANPAGRSRRRYRRSADATLAAVQAISAA